jgi:crossover junction endodeoxyribonuclease RusA
MSISFTVSGHAKPKGSMRAFVPKGWKRPILTNASLATKTWEQSVRLASQEFANTYTTDPVRVRLRFSLPRPKSLSSRASRAHVKRPDLDKLIRACLDAMTGVLWADDSQVYSLSATKCYALADKAPHVTITVSAKLYDDKHGDNRHSSDRSVP